jgi:hypothetical protein
MGKAKLKVPCIFTKFKKHVVHSDGTLWLSAGGRIVIDCGWGEYFSMDGGDKPICSLDELRQGFTKNDFIKRLKLASKPNTKGEK